MSQQGKLRQNVLESLTGNSGGPVFPDASENINIVGSPPIDVTGNPGTNTLTIDTNGTLAVTYTEDAGTATAASDNLNVFGDAPQGSVTSGAGDTITITNSDASETQKGVSELATDAEVIDGSDTTKTIVPTSLKAKLGVQTQNGIAFGDGDTMSLKWTDEPGDGELIIGATGSSPAAASITSTGGTITITPGPNTLNLEAGTTVPTTFVTDSGDAIPVANILNVLGVAVQGSSTSGAGNTLTITNSDATTTQKGVIETSTDAESIDGTSLVVAVTPASLGSKLGTQTSNGIPYGGGTTAALNWLAEATDGQLPIGSTGNPPSLNTLTSGTGIAITNGSGTITIDVTSSVATTFNGDTGSATPAANILDILGDAPQGSVTSAAGNTVTITNSDATTTQKGVLETSTDAESIAGTSLVVAVTPDSLSAKLGSQTSNGLSYGGGTTSPINWLAEATDGQLPIGSTGNPPSLNTITGGTGITVTNGSGTITINATSSGLTWTEVTGTSQTIVVDNGYIANNAGVVTFTLPILCALGEPVKIDGKGTGGWLIAQNAGQTIHFLSQDTTTGAGGSLASTLRYDCITLRCITADTEWIVESLVGNLTVV